MVSTAIVHDQKDPLCVPAALLDQAVLQRRLEGLKGKEAAIVASTWSS